MPVRALAARQQEIDCGRGRASVRVGARVLKGLAIVSALGVRLEIKRTDHFGGGQDAHRSGGF
jgi:hypothetical protein